MSSENFEKFRQIVLDDVNLQKQLREITEREPFIEFVIKLGAKHKLDFDAQIVSEAMRENRRVWIERWI